MQNNKTFFFSRIYGLVWIQDVEPQHFYQPQFLNRTALSENKLLVMRRAIPDW